MRVRLLPADGGEPIELTRDISVVGRREDCDVRVDHKSVSKHHCVLVKTEGIVLLRDLGSTNGTRVNGQRVRRAALVPDDVVAFAGVKYRLSSGRVDAAKAQSGKTQHMNADELQALLNRDEQPAPVPAARVEVHTHDLPDVYPPDSDAGPAT